MNNKCLECRENVEKMGKLVFNDGDEYTQDVYACKKETCGRTGLLTIGISEE